jgi:CRISPR type III-B/RAMP module RAMP protein Cmr4
MFKTARTLLLYTLEPVHIGAATGARGVDLPQTRDAWDDEPILPFSALRGMLADVCDPALRAVLLGAPSPGPRGVISPADARPVLFPVPSVAAGFAWITSPRWLARVSEPPDGVEVGPGQVVICQDSALDLRSGHGEGRVALAGTLFAARRDDTAFQGLRRWVSDILPDPDALGRRLAVVSDDECGRLLEHGMERRHRIRVEEGTVAPRALWSVEAIPRDAVFAAPLLAASPKLWDAAVRPQTAEKALERLREFLDRAEWVTIGGEITVGWGRCLARLC